MVNVVYGIEQANMTIEWTPPTNGGNVMYIIGTTPAPLSGATPDTDSTHINITISYNTNYMVTVGINTTCGVMQEATTFNIGGLAVADPGGGQRGQLPTRALWDFSR